jgi:7-cyano-7-deazaguanine reductase
MTSDEVTAICPITGQPDWYLVIIRYNPDKLCVESKSLKLYYHSLRSEGAFCEHLATSILKEVVEACKPRFCSVTVTQKSRGGISVESVSEYTALNPKKENDHG